MEGDRGGRSIGAGAMQVVEEAGMAKSWKLLEHWSTARRMEPAFVAVGAHEGQLVGKTGIQQDRLDGGGGDVGSCLLPGGPRVGGDQERRAG